jgi:hypothetical protein
MKGYKMATTVVAPRKVLLTPRFRASFPSVFEKTAFGDSTPSYSIVGLFFPKTFTDDEKAKWMAIRKQLDVVSMETFKKPMKELDRGIYKTPYHKGDEKSYEGYGDPAMVYFRMANAKRRPQILDMSGQPITAENSEEFYAGCWARASVNPFSNLKWKSLSIGLGNLQKIKDDKSFEGFTSAEDDFGGDAAEFDVGGEGDDDFGIGGGTPAAAEDDPTA